MMDFASMTKLNMRAVPSASGSVYLEVSSRVMKGRSATSMRRIHFTLAFPSHPGRKRRAGGTLPGGRGAPVWAEGGKAAAPPLSVGGIPRHHPPAPSPAAEHLAAGPP